MDGQQLGERFARLEEAQDGLDGRMAEMAAASTREHGEVKQILTEIRDDMAKKASKEEVEEVAKRTDKLESRSDKAMAIVGLAIVLSPLVIGYLLQITGGGS